MMAMAAYGEYRSAREAARSTKKGWAAALELAHALEEDERAVALVDWWRVAPLDEVAAEVVWGHPEDEDEDKQWQDALWWMCEDAWAIRLGRQVLASNTSLDLTPIAVQWVRIPAQAVAHFHHDWALIHDPANAGVTQKVFDALESGNLARIEYAAARAEQAIKVAHTAEQAATAQAKTAAEAAFWGVEATHAAATAAIASERAAEKAAQAMFAALAVGRVTSANLPNITEWARRWTVVVLEQIKLKMG